MNRRIEGRSADAPSPAGPYSQAVRIGTTVAAAGQAGFGLDGVLVDGVAAQTRRTLDNLVATLASCGATPGDVVHMRVYLTDPSQFAEMNAEYASYFDAPYPARTTVYVTLPPGMLVEMDALAVLSEEPA